MNAEFVVRNGCRVTTWNVSRGRIPAEAQVQASAPHAEFWKVTAKGRVVPVAIVEKGGRFYLRSL